MRPWFGGFVHRLDTIRDAIHLSGCTVMNRPASIRLMFDKYACQKKLASSASIAQPCYPCNDLRRTA